MSYSTITPAGEVALAISLPEGLDPQARQEIRNAEADAWRVIKRALKRADAPEGFKRFEIKQTKGPTLEFWGKLLCDDGFESMGRDAYHIGMEIYQTAAGAYVAVSSARPIDRDGFESVRATVVEPTSDEQARRFAVLDAFEWHQRARSMVTKKLKWSLRMDVE